VDAQAKLNLKHLLQISAKQCFWRNAKPPHQPPDAQPALAALTHSNPEDLTRPEACNMVSDTLLDF